MSCRHPFRQFRGRSGRRSRLFAARPNRLSVHLTLPGDAVIDLTVSGVGVGQDINAFLAASPTAPVIIMFTPSGQMGRCM